MKLFNPAVFGYPTFNTGGTTPPPPDHGGHRWPRREPIRVRLDVTDDEEAALVIAFLRHRFRI